MRLVLWQEVQAAFTLACMGPGGSGLPGALGACALARMMDADRKIAEKTRWDKLDPFLSSQNWMCFVFCSRYFFVLVCEGDWVAFLGAVARLQERKDYCICRD